MRGKIWILAWVFLSQMALSGVTLTHENGEVLEGAIVSYNPPSEGVKLKTAGQYKMVPFSEFTPESQQKITEWLADRMFKSSRLHIQVEEHVTTYKIKDEEYREEVEDIFYEIKLENRSSVDLKGLSIESGIFYKQELHGSTLPSQKYRKIDRMECDLSSKECRTFNTSIVKIEDRTLSSNNHIEYVYGNGASKTSKGRLEGMLLRVTRRSSSGKKLVRKTKKGHVPHKKKWGDYQKVY